MRCSAPSRASAWVVLEALYALARQIRRLELTQHPSEHSTRQTASLGSVRPVRVFHTEPQNGRGDVPDRRWLLADHERCIHECLERWTSRGISDLSAVAFQASRSSRPLLLVIHEFLSFSLVLPARTYLRHWKHREARRFMNDDYLITLAQAAEILGISIRTMYGLRQHGVIPVTIVGKRSVRIRRDDLNRYIEENLQPAPKQQKRRRA